MANHWDPAVSIPTLIGSLLSALGSSLILMCYLFLPDKRHYRHILIMNLAIADLGNSLNNSVSGLYVVSQQKRMQEGPACIFNGWFGQFTVQAGDFSILMMAVVTLLVIRGSSLMDNASMMKKILVCGSCWVVPVITSFTDLSVETGAGSCQLPDTIATCLRMDGGFLRRQFSQRVITAGESVECSNDAPSEWKSAGHTTFDSRLATSEPIHVEMTVHDENSSKEASSTFNRETAGFIKFQKIQKALLMNAYPIAYVILWIPGLANRFVELSGETSRILSIMQALTQFIGLANAITFGYNEQIRKQLMQRLRRRSGQIQIR
ncbi:hypothetical protein K432DRAFT_421753 [Lepidopterella palustris CBS 459.81]|uniref:Glucose receptor Git3-like N-terminal domain-containing protein n=1 Tax=Lepidopterella palustris CBS 459.81 TaxID=1314670 RepID=A0A8E2JJZ8_9PEZI|nr:hypothetical protein K432DRAFT_421753 [Lepidopterella palustris CBS 459.81]